MFVESGRNRRIDDEGDDAEIDEVSEGGYGSDGGIDEGETLQQFLANNFGAVEGGEDLPGPNDYVGSNVSGSISDLDGGDSNSDLAIRLDENGKPRLPSLAWIKANFKTKSAAIRFLLAQGHEVKNIASLLNVKYQHVRNVKVTYLKRGPNEDWNLERRRMSEKIEAEQREREKRDALIKSRD